MLQTYYLRDEQCRGQASSKSNGKAAGKRKLVPNRSILDIPILANPLVDIAVQCVAIGECGLDFFKHDSDVKLP